MFAFRRVLAPMMRAIKERDLDAQRATCDAERHDKELQAVAQYADACTQFQDLEDLYRHLTKQMAQTVGASACFLMLYEKAANTMVAQIPGHGLSDRTLGATRYVVTPEIKSAWNFSTQGSLLSNDPQGDRRVLRELVRGLGLFNCVVVPFFFQERVTGLIVAANKPKWFTYDDVRLLTAFSGYTSLAVANQQLQHGVRRTVRDSLTGLYTAHYFRTQLEQVIGNHEPDGPGHSLVAVTIDDFQSCVDLYGQPVADRVVKEVGGLLEDHAGDTAVVAHYGAQEFVVLLSRTDREDAVTAAERIRDIIEDHSFTVDLGIPLALTVSIGIASSRDQTSADSLLHAAQGALRRAKQAGKNLIVAAGAER
jgi:diguanylate cyclase (GGDEF)-like protein